MTMKTKPRKSAERSIPASEFKAKCLGLLDEVARKRAPVVITKRGKPVAKLVPIRQKPRDLFGYMAGSGKIIGDIISPIDGDWEALR
jgi:prevent-host-death family protein